MLRHEAHLHGRWVLPEVQPVSELPPIGSNVVTRFADGSDPSPTRSYLLYRIPDPDSEYCTFYQMQIRRPMMGVLIGLKTRSRAFDSDLQVMPCLMIPELGVVWVKEKSHAVVAID